MAKIGVFDSGIGGFTIVHEIIKKFPDLEIDYFSDDAYLPYGDKPCQFIVERSTAISKVLIERGANLILVACNTATACAIEVLRNTFAVPMVGVEPYLNYINQVGWQEIANKKIAVLTTVATGSSRRFQELKQKLDPHHQIDHYSMPKLASIIEHAFHHGPSTKLIKEIEEELENIAKKKYQIVILGCTHYPLIEGLIGKILNAQTIFPNIQIADRVGQILKLLPRIEPGINQRTNSINVFSSKVTVWQTIDLSKLKINFCDINAENG